MDPHNLDINKSVTPIINHIGIIMDGNRRWAKARGLKRLDGHRKGVEAVKKIVEGAIDNNIKYLTLYAFSSENWKRPSSEVQDLMSLLKLFLKSELNNLKTSGVRLSILGDMSAFSPEIIENLNKAITSTSNNKKINLVVAINYGSRQEITLALKNIINKVKTNCVSLNDINEDTIAAHLNTSGIPDPDLIIRTGGEFRLSNFLLWQSAYSELMFISKPWPDFNKYDLEYAINEFKKRDRRFGGI